VIAGLLALVGFQLAGEFIARTLDIPIPGSVIGMAIFFVYLQWRRPTEESAVLQAGQGLLKHLQLLFIPAGVGVVTYLSLIGDSAVPIAVGLIGSWLAALLVTAGSFLVLIRLQRGDSA
jgi:putative effector of murein hydrolase LrgA (UPF0299 family)